MNIERQDTGALTATLKLSLTPQDYMPGVDKALKEQRKTAALPGFRPGQVPMAIIKKRVGRSLMLGEVERLVGERLTGYIQENQLRVLGQPLPTNDALAGNDWEGEGELRFEYEMGLAPVVEVELNEKFPVTYPTIVVDDALVDREVADMRRRFGSVEDATTSADKDMLVADVIELDTTGAIKAGGLMNRSTISLEFIKDPAVRDQLVGKAVGDEVAVDPYGLTDDHEDLAKLLGTDHAGVHALEGKVLVRIAEIKRMVEVPVDQALFDRVYGQGAVPDEAAFRAKVKEGISAQLARDSDRVYRRLVLKKLVEDSSFELPDTFLKKWIQRTSEKPITPEEVEAGYSAYANGLRRQLLEDRVVEKYGLEAKGEELDANAKQYIAAQFAQYGIGLGHAVLCELCGMPEPDAEEVQRIAGRLLGDREQIKRMRDGIVERKMILHFRTMLAPKEEALSFDAFLALARTA